MQFGLPMELRHCMLNSRDSMYVVRRLIAVAAVIVVPSVEGSYCRKELIMEIADLSVRDISGLTRRKNTTSIPDGQQRVEVAELGVGALALCDSTNPPGRIFNSLRRNGRPSQTGFVAATCDR
jgi:hypothetical protein